MKKLILASSSPRRQQILKELGLQFDIIAPDQYEEKMDDHPPEELVCSNALGKARLVAQGYPKGLVIGCDTVIVMGGDILGKPEDPERARETLKKLSGRSHRVLSGLAVIGTEAGIEKVGYEATQIWFHKLADQDIDAYIAYGEPLDKAGAYGIQGRGELFIKKMEGSYSNVVGLPKSLLVNFLREAGFKI